MVFAKNHIPNAGVTHRCRRKTLIMKITIPGNHKIVTCYFVGLISAMYQYRYAYPAVWHWLVYSYFGLYVNQCILLSSMSNVVVHCYTNMFEVGVFVTSGATLQYLFAY